MKEGITHVLELSDVIRADLLAVFHSGAYLGDELAELVDTSGNLVEGSVLKVLHSGVHMRDEGVDVLDASLKVVNMLNLKCTNEDTVDQLDHIEGRDAKGASNVVVAFWIVLASSLAASHLGVGCSG